jgi:hypothetical protein
MLESARQLPLFHQRHLGPPDRRSAHHDLPLKMRKGQDEVRDAENIASMTIRMPDRFAGDFQERTPGNWEDCAL